MTTLAEFTTQRVTAGTRYQAAVTELLAALVDLAALDRTIENRRVGCAIPQPSFKGDLQELPRMLVHPVFAPVVSAGSRIADQIRVQADTYISQLS